ncbi:protein LURP-one-related 6-like [Pyrus ussuriensis x Pyrus communis]|uniref:Protein LURP-one-related 6-like n=1 Tax=Pyrus ussuriensis x Pyrus communis TaxID=2448454 RepID=A0A5N5I195_9ROSA|nr:protein LURP-one-related 6-like [Pyrus x bretschneideri]KAB2633985.1 protein LURP-one-related 6-like [Pyrus ussuriensis x Pyrus communis]
MAAKDNTVMPIISKMYCSSSQAVLVVRRRPHVINGGGFVVTDCRQKVAFKVDGCGILGKKDEMILRDSDGDALLLFRRKGATVEALSIYRRWRGYSLDYEGSQDQMVFCLKEPNSCLARTRAIRISTKATKNKDWDFEIKGNFPDKDCCIVDSEGKTMAQIGVKKEMMASEDLYHVVVTPGTDQAFVIGVITILDYIYGESTRC